MRAMRAMRCRVLSDASGGARESVGNGVPAHRRRRLLPPPSRPRAPTPASVRVSQRGADECPRVS
eukprot:3844989-Rhodomonas_salina.1